ncbi:methyltransferase domain-containing protein [Sporodiniella umbellata]|nr:methyltransferase domain-containing protein [Sporodiniella umbellata]
MAEFILPKEPFLLPKKYDCPKKYAEALVDYVETYRKWTEIHFVDFITLDHWQLLPEDWQSSLLNESDMFEAITKIAFGKYNEAWPLSLKEYIKNTKELELPRIHPYSSQQKIKPLEKRVLPGMVEKKIHEVERMVPVIQQLAKEQGIGSVMDLGAGQGYLSRALAYRSNLKVLAVDGSDVQTCGAKRFDERIMKGLKASDLQLFHVNERVTPENASSLLSRWRGAQDERWLLCGLHTCGDLASMILRLFVSSPEMTSLVNVGCCYHFLSEQTAQAGFPMSETLQKTGLVIGHTSRMLSSQVPERWVERAEDTAVALEHHFFRALLQHIMVQKGLAVPGKAPVIGRLNKKKDFTSFYVYVQAALARLGLLPETITQKEAEAHYTRYQSNRTDQKIAYVWSLRAILAPVFESIMLVDRWLYLNDVIPDSPTKKVCLWPLFDPMASPRNMVVMATK